MKTLLRNRTTAVLPIISVLLMCARSPCHAQPATSTANRIAAAVQRPILTFAPMTERQRVRQYLKRSFGPEALVKSAVVGGFGQWRDRPEEWGQGGSAYGKRVFSSYAGHLTDTTLEFGASNLLKEDNQYFLSERTGYLGRTLYAIESPFLARKNDGSRRFSYSHIGALVGAALI